MPLFRKRPQADDDGFYPTAVAPESVGEGEMVRATAGTDGAIITRLGGELYAFSDICPHAAADLSKGRLIQGRVKCPDHGYTFDVRSGRATWPEGEGCRLMRFIVRVQEGQIYLCPGWKPVEIG